MNYYLITFSSTHAAISAQKHLKGRIPYFVMPTLREISSSCGISLRIDLAYEEITEALEDFPMSHDMYSIYLVTPSEIRVIE